MSGKTPLRFISSSCASGSPEQIAQIARAALAAPLESSPPRKRPTSAGMAPSAKHASWASRPLPATAAKAEAAYSCALLAVLSCASPAPSTATSTWMQFWLPSSLPAAPSNSPDCAASASACTASVTIPSVSTVPVCSMWSARETL